MAGAPGPRTDDPSQREAAAPPALIDLVRAPIDLAAVHAALVDPACGAACVFVGSTRDHHEGRPVSGLEYEAYDDMARAELARIAAEVREAFADVRRVVLVHRLGPVPLGEASVAVGVATAHREAAFAAGRWAIDALKARAPIWKKEGYRDGADPRWVANCEARAEGGG